MSIQDIKIQQIQLPSLIKDRHDITEMLLKVALNTINPTLIKVGDLNLITGVI
jgi:hypothetical protein